MNRLADETSPYLQQHAHNPVDWYPWGDEALRKAREEGKPIFLSIGYSACHWCHVMERESFENEAIADYLNEHFVSIKVDREERPDVDNIYMEAVQVMTGHGGWPMSVFLRPDDLAPFFAGTYFPPEDRFQRPGFQSVLEQLVDVWENDPDRVEKVTGQVTERLELMASTMTGDDVVLGMEPIDGAIRHLEMTFDQAWGGFGDKPKFPPSMQLRLLLHVWADEDRDDDQRDRAIDIVEQTLVHMASGGMYDQIGGGFHRYSVDPQWLVPHFEKMLYDNALLTMAYTEGWQATGRSLYARVVRETIEYLRREMVAEGGGFYSSQDADSEGEEGKHFVWTPDELAEVLGPEDAERAAQFWGVREGGNFEGESIPNRLHVVSDDWTLAFDELPDDVIELRAKLLAARSERVAPGTDTKILAAWNGLAISAIARAGAVFDEPAWVDAAADAATFVWDTMRDDGELMRTFKDGRARFPGYLDDYAFMAAGLFDLFEATAQARWLDRCEELIDRAVELFWDDDGGAFFYTAEHHTDLLVRQKESYDGAVPASNSIAVMTLLRLSVATGKTALRQRAHTALQTFYPQMKKMPRSLAEMMQALDFHVSGPNEIVCFTPEGEASLARDAWLDYRPHAVIFDVPDDDYAERVPVARDRGVVDGAPTVYVCTDGVCELPRHEL